MVLWVKLTIWHDFRFSRSRESLRWQRQRRCKNAMKCVWEPRFVLIQESPPFHWKVFHVLASKDTSHSRNETVFMKRLFSSLYIILCCQNGVTFLVRISQLSLVGFHWNGNSHFSGIRKISPHFNSHFSGLKKSLLILIPTSVDCEKILLISIPASVDF